MAKRKFKKTGRNQSQRKPSPQQLKAIERLVARGNISSAISRLEALIKQYPKFSTLYLQGIDLYQEAQDPAKTAWCALRWTQSSPNSLQAWKNLLEAAMQQGYLALMIEATKQYNHLADLQNKEYVSALPIEEMYQELLQINPDNSQIKTKEDALIIDSGKILLDAWQWEDSLPYLESTNYYPPSANNHALALFQLGRVDEALESYQAAFTIEPENLFAMAAYIRLQVWNGNKDKAIRYANKLKKIRPRRPLYAESQLAVLVFLEMIEEAFECFQKITDEEIADMDDGFFHVVAVIAFRLDKKDLAKEYWGKATTDLYRGAETNPVSLLNTTTEKSRNPGLFTNSELLPVKWAEDVRSVSTQSKSDDDVFIVIKRELTPCPSLEYIRLAYETCDDFSLFIFEFILIARAIDGSKDEKHLLFELLKSHRTDVDYKMALLKRIQTLNILDQNEKINYWTGESISELKSFGFAITRDSLNDPLPDIAQDYYEDALAWMKDGKLTKARKMLEELCEQYPNDVSIKGNIASSWMIEDRKKGISKFENLLQDFPEYIFARCMLVENLIIEDQLVAANQLLKEALDGVNEIHVQDLILVYGVSAYLRAAEGDEEGAESYLEFAEKVAEYPDEIQKIEIWKNKVDRLLMNR